MGRLSIQTDEMRCRGKQVLRLFKTQRSHRIDASGATIQNPDRNERDYAEKHERRDEDCGIPCFDPKQKTRNEAGEPKGVANSNRRPN
jgi:hypothetical protein